MEVKPQKLSEFFNIGRDRGWDVERQVWTVNSLVDPEGKVFTLGEIMDGIPASLRIEKSGNRYGYPPLRDRIIQTQGYNLTRENVLTTLGTQNSNFLAMAVALNAGDEAVIESPSWEQPKVLAEALRVRPKVLKRRPELQWKFDLNELESLMSPKVRLIYICHPSNPTGALLGEDDLKAVGEIAGRYGAYVLSDEIYRGLEWSGTMSPSMANYYERGVSTSSVSKTLGMSGVRLGWLATQDRAFLERCMELKYYMSLHQQSRLDETVVMAALDPAKYRSLIKQTMDAARVNFELVSNWMERSRTFSWVPPGGGFLSFPSYNLGVPSWDMCVRLLEEPYRTYLIPGICYGYEGHVRLGFGSGTPAGTIQAGLDQVDRFVEDFQSGKVKLEPKSSVPAGRA